jgi:hypothetical protein
MSKPRKQIQALYLELVTELLPYAKLYNLYSPLPLDQQDAADALISNITNEAFAEITNPAAPQPVKDEDQANT